MDLLKQLCREQKYAKHMTNQAISDESGVPVSTVNCYFSSLSKCPSIFTVGPICAALDISLDEFFGICADKREVDKLKEREAITKDILSTIFPPQFVAEQIKNFLEVRT